MNKNIIFHKNGWEDYLIWFKEDKKIFTKINDLIENISQTPFKGLWKPEPLKNDLSGYWSRRVDDKHRLIYKVDGDNIYVISCRYHCKK